MTMNYQQLPSTSRPVDLANVNPEAFLPPPIIREELINKFWVKEGTYRRMRHSDYNRPRAPPQYQLVQGNPANMTQLHLGAPVRASFLNLKDKDPEGSRPHTPNDLNSSLQRSLTEEEARNYYSDKLCFNVGREIYIYNYRGTHKSADLSRPIDKRVYKGIAPTVHCFNQESASTTSALLTIGFSTGQLQVIDALEKATEKTISRLYNEDRSCDKSAVTCIRWVPGQPDTFVASFSSGNLLVFCEGMPNSVAPPVWHPVKQGDKYNVFTCKSKNPRNPVARWQVGVGPINQFSFSGNDSRLLATVGHDGYLRIFDYKEMELLSVMKSFFGGLISLAWSPDAKLIATGGEDDQLTIYSLSEQRVICRGHGHKSWISQVQFDPEFCISDDAETNGISSFDIGGSPHVSMHALETDLGRGPSTSGTSAVLRAERRNEPLIAASKFSRASYNSMSGIASTQSIMRTCYRVGSVGHDAQLCFWEITDDLLQKSNLTRHRNSTIIAPMAGLEVLTANIDDRLEPLTETSPLAALSGEQSSIEQSPDSSTNTHQKTKKKRLFKRKVKELFSPSSGTTNGDASTVNGSSYSTVVRRAENVEANIPSLPPANVDGVPIFGTKNCPRQNDVVTIQPLMTKKIAHERLTMLEFRKDCIVTACQEGYICTWARPGKGPPPPPETSRSNVARTLEYQSQSGDDMTSMPSTHYTNDPISNDRDNPLCQLPSRSHSSYSNYGNNAYETCNTASYRVKSVMNQ